MTLNLEGPLEPDRALDCARCGVRRPVLCELVDVARRPLPGLAGAVAPVEVRYALCQSCATWLAHGLRARIHAVEQKGEPSC